MEATIVRIAFKPWSFVRIIGTERSSHKPRSISLIGINSSGKSTPEYKPAQERSENCPNSRNKPAHKPLIGRKMT
jgi:hypothetical protein